MKGCFGCSYGSYDGPCTRETNCAQLRGEGDLMDQDKYTSVVSGFRVDQRLLRRRNVDTVQVWRSEQGWEWSLLGWDAQGRAWRRLTGASPAPGWDEAYITADYYARQVLHR